jgi:hypothetical protein
MGCRDGAENGVQGRCSLSALPPRAHTGVATDWINQCALMRAGHCRHQLGTDFRPPFFCIVFCIVFCARSLAPLVTFFCGAGGHTHCVAHRGLC